MELVVVFFFLAAVSFRYAYSVWFTPESVAWCVFGVLFFVFALRHLGAHI